MKNRGSTLDIEFYRRDTKKVARELIGKILHHRVDGFVASGIITETEAYLGVRDSAAHTYGGRKTDRVASMYKMGGHAYVYFIYGVHFCFNVVTQDEARPEAVLIRALEPFSGLDAMRKRRGFSESRKVADLCSGPGKLCQAMGIDRDDDGLRLDGKKLWISDDTRIEAPKFKILAGPRVGVDYALEPIGRPARDWPLRFTVKKGNVKS